MGKEYFEFLEEEFQGLTSQVQEALKGCMQANSFDSKIDIPSLFTRCHGIYEQMRAEATSNQKRGQNPEFRQRLTLYSIQLTALLEHYQNLQFEAYPESPSSPPREVMSELTFTFTIDDDDDTTIPV